MENKFIRPSDVEKKLLESNTDSFDMALFLKSYLEDEKELLILNLYASKTRVEDIGTINFLSFITNKINLIQEKRNEG